MATISDYLGKQIPTEVIELFVVEETRYEAEPDHSSYHKNMDAAKLGEDEAVSLDESKDRDFSINRHFAVKFDDGSIFLLKDSDSITFTSEESLRSRAKTRALNKLNDADFIALGLKTKS